MKARVVALIQTRTGKFARFLILDGNHKPGTMRLFDVPDDGYQIGDKVWFTPVKIMRKLAVAEGHTYVPPTESAHDGPTTYAEHLAVDKQEENRVRAEAGGPTGQPVFKAYLENGKLKLETGMTLPPGMYTIQLTEVRQDPPFLPGKEAAEAYPPEGI